jgi:hypothetical protein
MKAAGRTCRAQPAEDNAIQAPPGHKCLHSILRGWFKILNPFKGAKMGAREAGVEIRSLLIALVVTAGIALAAAQTHAISRQED